MERTRERIRVARKALNTLKPLLGRGISEVERDAAIHRFEYSFETVWKAAQGYLREVEGVVVSSPKGVVRATQAAGILQEVQARIALEMVDDRNQSVHLYNEKLAEIIFSRLLDYADLMSIWLDVMEENYER